MLKFLGKFLRGKATKIGVGLLGGGTVGLSASPAVGATFGEDIKALTDFVSALTMLVGTVVSAFGVGRKAAAAADAPELPVRPDA